MSRLTKDIKLAKVKDIRQLPRVEVHWADASANGGWRTLQEHRENGCAEVESLGYLTKNTRNELQLAQSRSDNGTVADSITIPKKWIISAKYLSKPR